MNLLNVEHGVFVDVKKWLNVDISFDPFSLTLF